MGECIVQWQNLNVVGFRKCFLLRSWYARWSQNAEETGSLYRYGERSLSLFDHLSKINKVWWKGGKTVNILSLLHAVKAEDELSCDQETSRRQKVDCKWANWFLDFTIYVKYSLEGTMQWQNISTQGIHGFYQNCLVDEWWEGEETYVNRDVLSPPG